VLFIKTVEDHIHIISGNLHTDLSKVHVALEFHWTLNIY